MKTIGIKLADGSFYPILQDSTPGEKTLELTTAHNNQTKVMVDLYRSATCSMEDAEYVDSLQIENLVAHPNGEPDISFSISLDEDNQLSAKIVDKETGNTSNTDITLVSRTLEERLVTDEYDISEDNDNTAAAAVAGAVAAGGLLASAAALRDKKESTETEDTTIAETETTESEPETAVVEPVETSSDETFVDETISDMPDDFADMPDFSENTESTEVSDETVADDFGDLPDFPDNTESTEASDETIADDFGDLPDFSDNTDTTEETPEMPDDFFNTETEEDTTMNNNFDDDIPASDGLNFDGLYDKETERGESAASEEDVVKRKTKTPVIICIICAIICIIATVLILFIIPSKCNLLTKKGPKETTEVAIEKPAPQEETPAPEPEPKPEPKVPEAKEDEVIIIEKAEDVVPAQPPVAEEKPKNITYKIKWGDTLWDIADTYYKNPWRYKYIARYNGIKDPDYIISGTKIIIPAE